MSATLRIRAAAPIWRSLSPGFANPAAEPVEKVFIGHVGQRGGGAFENQSAQAMTVEVFADQFADILAGSAVTARRDLALDEGFEGFGQRYVHRAHAKKLSAFAKNWQQCNRSWSMNDETRLAVLPNQVGFDWIAEKVAENLHDAGMEAKVKTIAATEFEATCLRVIEQMCEDREPVTITENGRPLAVLSPVPPAEKTASIFGAMEGSVLSYDDPFRPVFDLPD